MKKKISCLIIGFVLVCSVFLFSACGMNETEESWPNNGAWTEIYVYKGKGDLLSINWNEEDKKGIAKILNTDASYTKDYVELYKNDSNYISSTTGLPISYNGNVEAFETKDGRIWVRIIWTDTSTFLLVRIYE